VACACLLACEHACRRRLDACLLERDAEINSEQFTALTVPPRLPLPPAQVCGAVRFKDKGREKQRQAGLKQRQKERLETAAGRKDAQRKAAQASAGEGWHCAAPGWAVGCAVGWASVHQPRMQCNPLPA
jgi:hypothetical protein